MHRQVVHSRGRGRRPPAAAATQHGSTGPPSHHPCTRCRQPAAEASRHQQPAAGRQRQRQGQHAGPSKVSGSGHGRTAKHAAATGKSSKGKGPQYPPAEPLHTVHSHHAQHTVTRRHGHVTSPHRASMRDDGLDMCVARRGRPHPRLELAAAAYRTQATAVLRCPDRSRRIGPAAPGVVGT
jgi:hypothetical protein